MTLDRIGVTAGGAALVIFLYWFFFRKRETSGEAKRVGDVQAAVIVVAGGYSPAMVVAKKGVPLQLIFDRQEDSPCSEELVIPEFEVRKVLAAFSRTTIEVLPVRAGEFPFSCGMNMLHGRIRVVE